MSTRKLAQRIAGNLQSGSSLFAGDRGERLEKFVQGIARCQVIDEVLERHARSDKNRFAAHDSGITVYDACYRVNRSLLRARFKDSD